MGEDPKVSRRVQVRMENSRKHYDSVKVNMEDSIQLCVNTINIYAGVEELHKNKSQEIKTKSVGTFS